MNTATRFVILIILLASSAAQTSPNCYDAKRASEYRTAFANFDFQKSDSDLCQFGSPVVELSHAFDYIRNLKFTKMHSTPLSPGIINEPYFDYFLKRTRTVYGPNSHSAKTDFYCGVVPNGASSAAKMSAGKEMTLCSGFFSPMDDDLERSETLIHEARHSDHFPHVACRNDRIFKGSPSPACDENFSDGGSYAVGVEFLARIHLFASNVSEFHRVKARLKALYDLQHHFNHSPIINTVTASVAREASTGQIYLVTGTRLLRTQATAPGPAKIYSGGNGIYFALPLDEKKAASKFSIYSSDKIVQNAKVKNEDFDELLWYRLTNLKSEQRSDLLYYEHFDYSTSGKEMGYIEVSRNQSGFRYFSKAQEVNFPQAGKIIDVRAALPGCELSENGEQRYFRNITGQVFVLSIDTGLTKQSQCKWPDAQGYALLSGHQVFLENGKLSVRDGVGSKNVDLAPGQSFDLLMPQAIEIDLDLIQ